MAGSCGLRTMSLALVFCLAGLARCSSAEPDPATGSATAGAPTQQKAANGEDGAKRAQEALAKAMAKGGKPQRELALVRSAPPKYPAEAREQGVQGIVTLEVTVDAKGEPTEVVAIDGPAALRNAAVEAVRQWRYAEPPQPPMKITETIAFGAPGL